jgi:acetyl-CoA acetyltransferase
MKIFRKEGPSVREVVITSAVRTAIGNFFGGLSSFTATELGGKVIEEGPAIEDLAKMSMK